jgi:hypothetical protein
MVTKHSFFSIWWKTLWNTHILTLRASLMAQALIKLTHQTSQSSECLGWCYLTSPVVHHHWAAELVGQSLSKDLLDWLVQQVSLYSEGAVELHSPACEHILVGLQLSSNCGLALCDPLSSATLDIIQFNPECPTMDGWWRWCGQVRADWLTDLFFLVESAGCWVLGLCWSFNPFNQCIAMCM